MSIPQSIDEDKHWWFNTRTKGLLRVIDQHVERDESVVAERNHSDDGLVALHSGAARIVLDVGCGAGNMMHHLSRYGRVTGVDNFAKPLAICRERGWDAQMAPAEALPYADNSFGLVALLDVVEHCADDAQVLRECFRVCSPGGYLAVTVPAFQWLWTDNDTINGHKRRYTVGQLRQVLAQAGFAPRRASYAFFLVFPLAAGLLVLRRLAGRRQKLATPRQDDDAYQVEMEPTHPILNSVLDAFGSLEAALIGRFDLPIGSSIVAIAQKPR